MHRGSVHAQALCPSHLRPQAELLGSCADRNELIRGNIATWAARNHGVGASLLDVGKETVIGVLDLIASLSQHIVIPQASQNGGGHRLAELASIAPYCRFLNCLFEGLDLLDTDNVEELLARVWEAVADTSLDLLAHGLQSRSQHPRDFANRCATTSTACSCLCALLDLGQSVALFLLDGLYDVSLADTQASAHHVIVSDASAVATIYCCQLCPRWWSLVCQALRIIFANVILLAQLQELWVILGITHENTSNQLSAIFAEAETAVGTLQLVDAVNIHYIWVLAIELSLEPEGLIAPE
mmetsp:Transcript_3303/g.5464  ORF Transcript_3303/g.5464 Transcript_3303/m.5464 type:complete len:298 (-) Transcript_3303:1164-2057(-)